MSQHLINSPWLSDWRKFLDQASGLSNEQRRTVEEAIRQTEQKYADMHDRQYQGRLDTRKKARKDLKSTLEAIEDDAEALVKKVETNRMTGQQARAQLRNLVRTHTRMTELTNELICTCPKPEDQPDKPCRPDCKEDQLERFSQATPDEYQKRWAEGLSGIVRDTLMPSLASVAQQIDPPPPPGGAFGPSEFAPAYATADNAPGPDDIPLNPR